MKRAGDTLRAVSGEPCHWILDWLDEQGISAHDWIGDLPISVEALRQATGRVSWPVFLSLCERLTGIAPAPSR